VLISNLYGLCVLNKVIYFFQYSLNNIVCCSIINILLCPYNTFSIGKHDHTKSFFDGFISNC